jgi:two-component system LytT family response regulator
VWEDLAGYPFARTHKGFLVNLEMVREIKPYGRDTYELALAHTKKRAVMTRERFRELETLLAVGKRPWKE